jgi:hypothetical protein
LPDIPPEVLAAVDAVLDDLPQPDSRFERDRWRIASRVALNAAAPILAEEIAQKILAHANRRPGAGKVWAGALGAWHRHFGIAARVAAGAFTTEEESKRATAGALARGDFIACKSPEDGNG